MKFVPRTFNASPLLFGQLLQAIAKSDKPILEIDGYPAHGDKIELLEPAQRKQIAALAKRIVDSHKGATPIIAFAVDGHADVDFSVPKTDRARVEQEVSQKRAEAARNALLSEMIKLDRGASIANVMPFVAQGFGSKFIKKAPSATKPLTEAEMRKNRRVEFFIAQFVQPPPPKPTPPAGPKPPETGVHWQIQIKRGRTVSTPPLPEPLDNVGGGVTTLNLVITDLDRGKTGKFTATVTGMILPSASVVPSFSPTPQVEQITEGKAVKFETTRGVVLDDFIGDIEVTQDPGIGVSVLTAGGDFNFEFDRLALKGIFPKKHPVSVPAGSSALATPKGGLGFASKGTLSKD